MIHGANGYAFGLLIQEVPPEVAIWTLVYTPVEVLAFASGGSVGLLAAVNAWVSVSNSSSGRRWKLDHAPAVGDPTHMVEFGTGRRAFAREA